MKAFGVGALLVRYGPGLYRSMRAMLLLTAVPVTAIAAQFKQSTLVTVPVTPTTRVEAGVKVHQHDKTAFARATQLELVGAPIAVIGGANGDPDYDLTNVEQVALLSDGRVATLYGAKFFLFGANGQPQRTIASVGSGPGELRGATGNLLLATDTLFVLDLQNRQFNWCTPDKGFARGKQYVFDPRLRLTSVVGVLPGSRIVMSSMGTMVGSAATLGKIVRPLAPIAVISADGRSTPFAEVPDFELTEINVTYRGKPGTTSRPIRFPKRAIATVWDSTVVTGTGDAYQLDVRNGNGAVVSRISVNTPRVLITRAMIDTIIGAAMQRIRNTSSAERMTLTLQELEKAERDTPVADSLPPYAMLFVTPNKTLWVMDYPVPGTVGWSATAFRKDGAMLGRLHIAGAGFPLTFGDDRVVVRSEDQDGVVSLKVQRIGIGSAKPK